MRIHQHETRRVPEFVAEMFVALDPSKVESNIPTSRRKRCKRETQGVGAIRIDPVRKLLPGRLLYLWLQMRLHQPGRSFFE